MSENIENCRGIFEERLFDFGSMRHAIIMNDSTKIERNNLKNHFDIVYSHITSICRTKWYAGYAELTGTCVSLFFGAEADIPEWNGWGWGGN